MRASEYEPFIDDKREWISDKYFTQQRFAGVNPMSLRRVTFHRASKGQRFPFFPKRAGWGGVSVTHGLYEYLLTNRVNCFLPLCLYCSRKRKLRKTEFKEQGMCHIP